MAIILSLLSALAYGISDFLGGIFAKRSTPWQVGVVGQSSAAICALLATTAIGWHAATSDLVAGMAGGLGSGAGVVFLYRGLSRSRMTLVAPIAALETALLPVIVGLATGERPNGPAAIGIIAALPAITLIARAGSEVGAAGTTHRGGVIDGMMAGVGFGILFTMLGQTSGASGLAPVAMSQLASAATVVTLATILKRAWVPTETASLRATVMGPLSTGAQAAFLYATHYGLLSVVSVISSLYPALTVVLAVILLQERIHRSQGLGLVFAALSVSLVAIA